MPKLDKFFISDIDKKLADFNRSHPKSDAQLSEIRKYQRVHTLRDDAQATDPEANSSDTIFE